MVTYGMAILICTAMWRTQRIIIGSIVELLTDLWHSEPLLRDTDPVRIAYSDAVIRKAAVCSDRLQRLDVGKHDRIIRISFLCFDADTSLQ